MGVTWQVPAHYFSVRSDFSRNVVGMRDSGYEFESVGIERASQHNNCRLIKVLETGGADAVAHRSNPMLDTCSSSQDLHDVWKGTGEWARRIHKAELSVPRS